MFVSDEVSACSECIRNFVADAFSRELNKIDRYARGGSLDKCEMCGRSLSSGRVLLRANEHTLCSDCIGVCVSEMFGIKYLGDRESSEYSAVVDLDGFSKKRGAE